MEVSTHSFAKLVLKSSLTEDWSTKTSFSKLPERDATKTCNTFIARWLHLNLQYFYCQPNWQKVFFTVHARIMERCACTGWLKSIGRNEHFKGSASCPFPNKQQRKELLFNCCFLDIKQRNKKTRYSRMKKTCSNIYRIARLHKVPMWATRVIRLREKYAP